MEFTYLLLFISVIANAYQVFNYKKQHSKLKAKVLDVLALESQLKAAKEKPTADAKHLLRELLNGSALLEVSVVDKEYLMIHSPKGLI